MKKSVKRLSLTAETLRHLDAADLNRPAGGATAVSCTGCTTRRPPCDQSFVDTCLC